MNIRCVLTEGVFNDSCCQLNDRRILDSVRREIDLVEVELFFLLLSSLIDHAVNLSLRINSADSSVKCSLGSHYRSYVTAGYNSEVFKNVEVTWIVGSNGKALAHFFDRNNVILSCRCLRDLLNDIRYQLGIIKVDVRDTESLSEHFCKLRIGDKSHFDDNVTEHFSFSFFLLGKYLLKLSLSDELFFHKVLSNWSVSHTFSPISSLKRVIYLY